MAPLVQPNAAPKAAEQSTSALALPAESFTEPLDATEVVAPQQRQLTDAREIDESGEAMQAKAKGIPAMPPLPERRLHRLTHYPYRNWCKACVACCGRDDPHPSTHGAVRDMARIWMDYSFPGKQDGSSPLTLLTILDEGSQALETAAPTEKGIADYPVRVV